ncbi:MAG: transposase family protein [Candidatus Methylacidiphilales bacterium]|nr:transposase family protein [Candidatus Methylacidiphilales bacterium]
MKRDTSQPEDLAQKFKAACASAKARLHYGIAQIHEQLQQLCPGEPITTEALFRNCLAILSDRVSFSKVYRVQKRIEVIAKSGRTPLITDFIEKRGTYDRGGKRIPDETFLKAWLIAETMRRRKNGTMRTVAEKILRGLLKPGQRMVSARSVRRRIRKILMDPKYAQLLQNKIEKELPKLPGNNMIPGEHWATDTYALNIKALDYRGGQGELKVTEIVDIGSLCVLSAVVTVGEPNVQAVVLALLMAMEPLPLFEYRLIPKSLRTDRGSVFTSREFQARLAAMGIMHS